MGGRGSLSYNGHKIRVTATGKKVSGAMVRRIIELTYAIKHKA